MGGRGGGAACSFEQPVARVAIARKKKIAGFRLAAALLTKMRIINFGSPIRTFRLVRLRRPQSRRIPAASTLEAPRIHQLTSSLPSCFRTSAGLLEHRFVADGALALPRPVVVTVARS